MKHARAQWLECMACKLGVLGSSSWEWGGAGAARIYIPTRNLHLGPEFTNSPEFTKITSNSPGASHR